MAQHGFGHSETLFSAPPYYSMLSTHCSGTCGSDILDKYPVKERDPLASRVTLHYMAIACVFRSDGDLKWSLEELRLQDYLNVQRPLSDGFTRDVSTTTSINNKPSGCLIIENDQNISILG